MGMPCTMAVARHPGEKTDHASVKESLGERPPTLLFGSYNERLYAAELGLRGLGGGRDDQALGLASSA